jgi:hypothetical protein
LLALCLHSVGYDYDSGWIVPRCYGISEPSSLTVSCRHFQQRTGEVDLILDFQSNSLTTVEQPEQGLWQVTSRYDDNLFSAEAVLTVRFPTLDITRADLTVRRDALGLAPDPRSAAENLVGVRIGPGMTQIVRGIFGATSGSDRMADLILESMEMLINALTVPELRKAVDAGGVALVSDKEGPKVQLNDKVIGGDMVKLMAQNPRLKDSCVAFLGLDE